MAVALYSTPISLPNLARLGAVRRCISDNDFAVWLEIVSHARPYSWLDGGDDAQGLLKLRLETYLDGRFGCGGWDGERCLFSSVGRDEIMRATGLERRTVTNCIKRLGDRYGLVSVAEKPRSGGKYGGPGRVTCYAIEPLCGRAPKACL